MSRAALDERWQIEYLQREQRNDANRSVPARAYLQSCPVKVRARLQAILTEVAAAPPYRFQPSQMWHVMRDEMRGYYEVRALGRDASQRRRLYRIFCLLDHDGPGLQSPSIVLITGMDKPPETSFTAAERRRAGSRR